MNAVGFRSAAASLAVCSSLFLANDVAAQSLDGRVRLSFEGSVFGIRSLTLKPDVEGAQGVTATQTSLGLASSSFGPGIAGGLSENVVLGARVSFLHTKETIDDAEESVDSTGFGLYGTLEYVIGEPAPVRGYFGPLLGVESASGKSGSVETSAHAILIGATGGMHAFLTDSFSIDPSFTLAYVTGGRSTDLGGELDSADADLTGVAFLVGFSLSGWLGGEKTRAAPVETSDYPAESASVEAAPSAEPSLPDAPSATTVRADSVIAAEEATELTLRLNPTDSLRLTAEPGDTDVAFTLLLATNADSERCSVITFDGGGKDDTFTAAQARVVPRGSASVLAVTGTAPLASLRTAANKKHDVLLDACGRSFKLNAEARQQVRSFIRTVKRRYDELHPGEQEQKEETPPAAPETQEAPSAPPPGSDDPPAP